MKITYDKEADALYIRLLEGGKTASVRHVVGGTQVKGNQEGDNDP